MGRKIFLKYDKDEANNGSIPVNSKGVLTPIEYEPKIFYIDAITNTELEFTKDGESISQEDIFDAYNLGKNIVIRYRVTTNDTELSDYAFADRTIYLKLSDMKIMYNIVPNKKVLYFRNFIPVKSPSGSDYDEIWLFEISIYEGSNNTKKIKKILSIS